MENLKRKNNHYHYLYYYNQKCEQEDILQKLTFYFSQKKVNYAYLEQHESKWFSEKKKMKSEFEFSVNYSLVINKE